MKKSNIAGKTAIMQHTTSRLLEGEERKRSLATGYSNKWQKHVITHQCSGCSNKQPRPIGSTAVKTLDLLGNDGFN